MTKILHIITRLDMGGSAQNTLLTCRQLSDTYEMVLVHGPSQESHMTDSEKRSVKKAIDEAKQSGVRFICISSLLRRIHPAKDIRTILFLIWLIVKEKPAIVHTHSSKAGILGRWAARMERIPVIIHTYHGFGFHRGQRPWVRWIFKTLERWTGMVTHMFIMVSKANEETIRRNRIKSRDGWTLIRSGIPIMDFSQVEEPKEEIRRSLGFSEAAFGESWIFSYFTFYIWLALFFLLRYNL